jgi:hypothetical protein
MERSFRFFLLLRKGRASVRPLSFQRLIKRNDFDFFWKIMAGWHNSY